MTNVTNFWLAFSLPPIYSYRMTETKPLANVTFNGQPLAVVESHVCGKWDDEGHCILHRCPLHGGHDVVEVIAADGTVVNRTEDSWW